MMHDADLDLLKGFPAAAEYLSNIHLIMRDYGAVTNTRLAEWLGVSAPAVTQGLGRLRRLGLVDYKRYGGISLTEKGRQMALTVLKRHYLLEHLLVQVLEYPWDKADEEAKILQNQISDDLARHLDQRLGHPQTCPHGNPLPGTAAETKLLQAPRLSDQEPGESVMILRITEEGEALPRMLPFCQSHGVKPGRRFKILNRRDQGMELQAEGSNASMFIEDVLSRHICVDVLPA